MSSMSTIRPFAVGKAKATRALPPGDHTSPGAPLTSGGWAARARPEKVAATARAPRTSLGVPAVTGPVGSQYNARVEHREKRVELTTPRSGEEGVHNFSLTNSIGIGNRRCTLDPAPCAAGELPGRGWGAIHNWSDLFEGQASVCRTT